jgi:hypothetical protein
MLEKWSCFLCLKITGQHILLVNHFQKCLVTIQLYPAFKFWKGGGGGCNGGGGCEEELRVRIRIRWWWCNMD